MAGILHLLLFLLHRRDSSVRTVPTRVKRSRLGVVADYCGFCHQIRPFTLYLNVGIGRPEYQIECQTCGIVYKTNSVQYAGFVDDPRTPVASWAEKSHPGIMRKYGWALGVGCGVGNGRLTQEERWGMLLEPVMGVGAESAECDRRSGLKQTFGRLLWASGLCFVLWALVAPWAAVSMGKSHAAVGGWLLLVVLPPVMAFGRLQVRRARRRLLAKVAYSIQSLEPTFDELVLLVEYLRYRLDPILGATSVDQLRRLIHSAKPAKIRARARKLSRDEVRQEGERFSLWRASRLRMPAQVHEPDATAALSMGTADRCSEQL